MVLNFCYGLIERAGEIWRSFFSQKTLSPPPLVLRKNTTDLMLQLYSFSLKSSYKPAYFPSTDHLKTQVD